MKFSFILLTNSNVALLHIFFFNVATSNSIAPIIPILLMFSFLFLPISYLCIKQYIFSCFKFMISRLCNTFFISALKQIFQASSTPDNSDVHHQYDRAHCLNSGLPDSLPYQGSYQDSCRSLLDLHPVLHL